MAFLLKVTALLFEAQRAAATTATAAACRTLSLNVGTDKTDILSSCDVCPEVDIVAHLILS